MAKSKEHKQSEAIERKRSLYAKNFAHYFKHQYGTATYYETEKRCGTEYAQNLADSNKATFERYCAEARIDKHGNLL